MLNKELQKELRLKYNPDDSILRRAQLRMLEMLLYIDKICKENDIEYWLEGGTLLGAVRHGGFIPWDDDVDITMTRSNYHRFRQIVLNHPHEQFVLQEHSTDSKYYNLWPVLRDLKSEYIQDSLLHKVRKYRGLQVDIFLMDDFIIQPFRFISLCVNALINKLILFTDNPIMHLGVHGLYHLENGILIPVFNAISKVNSNRKRLRMGYGIPFMYEFDKADVFPVSPILFEGHWFYGPANPMNCLCKTFGDYMSIPEEKERCTHDTKIVFY
ncbi:LicD family protein [uncultured Bacteroides sp.]|jgi:licD family protein|uniref:LicD family protein n=1 Tax=uncultured Bacteroides sp. TaxID=162156 RepID=UPI00280B3C07|nr:LicD family protein [uncultured Bacteroides sp.]